MKVKDWDKSLMKEPAHSIDEVYLVTPKQRRQATTKRANAKIEEIRERLRALALEKGPGSQLPTIRELCAQLNTSSATLTAALDLLETEQILCRKERQGIFVANTIHQSQIHIVFNVSCFTDTGTSPFWALLWAKLMQETEHRSTFKNEQYRFHFPCRPQGQALPEDYAALLNSPQVDGCLLVGLNARRMDHSRLLHIPHVVFAGGGDIIVQDDVQEKTRLAVQKLVAQGCQRIAFWTPIWTSAGYDNEATFFKQFLVENGVPVYPDLFRVASIPPFADKRTLTLQEQGYLLAKEVFSSPAENKPDGVYICDDMMTSGAIAAWEELGIAVGEDVKVVSLANTGSPILFGKLKQLATVEFDPGDFARAMFFHLDRAMAQGYQPEEVIIKIRPRLHS